MKMRQPAALIVIVCIKLFLAPALHAQFMRQGPKLIGTGAVGPRNNQQVKSVALSADGNTAIVVRNTETYVWTRSGGTWTQQTRLLDAGVDSASLSADGNTLIAGASHDNDDAGAAWVWTRSGNFWSPQSNKLVGSGALGNAHQGTSVAISADGNTAIVGGPAYGLDPIVGGFHGKVSGAAWVWTRSAGVWKQQGPRLEGVSQSGGAQQGSFVAISADGNTAIVGGRSYYANTPPEGAWVWTRSGGVWTQQGGALIGSGALLGGGDFITAARNGNPVAISADGNTAIVGSPNDNGDIGALWVWTRSGAVWTPQGNKLTASDAVRTSYQANSLALSSDGNTILAGGYGDNDGFGAVWVWKRSGGAWTQQGTKRVGSGVTTASNQGNSVAISGDGNTALAGGYGDGGPVWVWTKSAETWTQQGERLRGSGGSGVIVWQGYSVAISSDGNTAIVGAILDNGGVGAAWVWTKTGGTWTQQRNKLVGSGAKGSSYQGTSIALSADGNTAIVGGYGDNGYIGAAWVWTRIGDVWVQQGSKLVGSLSVGTSYQGAAVALSADGNTAIIGGYGDNNSAGAAWVWTRTNGVWTQQGYKLIGAGVVTCAAEGCPGGANQGESVALSADGNTAIVGGIGDNRFVPTGYPPGFSPGYRTLGAAWVWTRSGGVWTQQGDKLVGSGEYTDRITGTNLQGASVALAGDGNTAIIGGAGGPGAAWIWTRSGSRWTEQARLAQANVQGQGSVVALSYDGNTALVKGYSGRNMTWVWTKSGGAWPQQGSRLIDIDVDVFVVGFRGHSAAISGDGKTVIVGESDDNSGVGGAWIFVPAPRRRATMP